MHRQAFERTTPAVAETRLTRSSVYEGAEVHFGPAPIVRDSMAGTVQKKSATPTTCDPFQAFENNVGLKPEKPRRFGKVRGFRKMQEAAFLALKDASAWVLNSGTGSGKSVVQKALAFTLARKGEKCVIAVPETSIAKSFATEFDGASIQAYHLPDGTDMAWQVLPQNFLFADKASISDKSITNRLIEFVEAKQLTPEACVIVCTHVALVRAHQELVRRWVAKGRSRRSAPWKGVHVFIDEAHHAKAMDDATKAELEQSNRLGDLVKHFIDYKPGRIGLTTATWLRGDSQTIVPDSHISAFVQFEYPMDDYLNSLRFLKKIAFKFSIGDYAEVLKKEFSANPVKTIVYQPAIKSGEGSEKKLEYLQTFQEALKKFNLRTIDLVTPEGRDERRKAFEAAQESADVIFVQNLFREGADWPMARRSIVLGSRGSLPMVIQMLGRLLRDYEGKDRIEFHIVLPKDVLADISFFQSYASAIFMVMALGWQFTVGLKLPAVIRNSETLKKLSEALQDASVRGENKPAGEVMRDALRKALEGSASSIPEVTLNKAAESAMTCLRGAFRVAANAAKDLLTPKSAKALRDAIEHDPFQAAQALYAAQWDAERFQAFRSNYIGLPEVTPEYVDRLLILNRCKHFQQKGQYVDPRTIPGLVKYFGSKKALDEACRAEGL
jgi:adenylylsulfate kinase-like enzyme